VKEKQNVTTHALKKASPELKKKLISGETELIIEGEPLAPFLKQHGLRDSHLATILRWRDKEFGYDLTKPEKPRAAPSEVTDDEAPATSNNTAPASEDEDPDGEPPY
jgi:hypothetical protein